MSFSNLEEVQEWLKDLLSQGPVLASEVLEEASELEINSSGSNSILYKAKERLRIKSTKAPNGDWWWNDPLVSMNDQQQDEWFKKYSGWLEKNGKDLKTSEEYREFDDLLDHEDKVVDYDDDPYEWLDQNSVYYFGEAKADIKDKEREAVLHRKEYKEYYGYDPFPNTDYGIQPSKC